MAIANMVRDVSGAVTYGLPFSNNIYSATLTANTDTTLTVPYIDAMGNATLNGTALPNIMAIISWTQGNDLFVALGATAAAPAGASFASTTSEQNPAVKYVQGGQVMHFKTASTGVNVTVSFYSLD